MRSKEIRLYCSIHYPINISIDPMLIVTSIYIISNVILYFYKTYRRNSNINSCLEIENSTSYLSYIYLESEF